MPQLSFSYPFVARKAAPRVQHAPAAVDSIPTAEKCVVASLVVISVLLTSAVVLDAAGLWILI